MIDAAKIYLIHRGYVAHKLMAVALELKVFDILSASPGLNLDEMAAKLSLQRRAARFFLRALVSLELLDSKEGKFSNPPIVEQMLVRGKPSYYGGQVTFAEKIEYMPTSMLAECLKANDNLGLSTILNDGASGNIYDRMHKTKNREMQEIFYGGMGSVSAYAVDKALTSAFDYGSVKHALDFLGGDATNAIALARTYPNMKITLLDLPSVCEIAARNIQAAGLTDRIKVHPCDIFVDKLPTGFDAAFLFHCSSIWTTEKWRDVVKKVHDALDPGARILVYNIVCNDEDTGPIEAAILSIYFLVAATPEGGIYTGAEHAEGLKYGGFQDVKRVPMPNFHELLHAHKAS